MRVKSALVCALLISFNPTVGNAGEHVEYLNSGKILPAGLPFSEAVRVGNTLFLSGQIGVRPDGSLAEGGAEGAPGSAAPATSPKPSAPDARPPRRWCRR